MNCSSKSIIANHQSTGAINKASSLTVHRNLCGDITQSKAGHSSELIEGKVSTECRSGKLINRKRGVENFHTNIRSGRQRQGLCAFGTKFELIGN